MRSRVVVWGIAPDDVDVVPRRRLELLQPLRPQRPQRCVSTNSTTSARGAGSYDHSQPAVGMSIASAGGVTVSGMRGRVPLRTPGCLPSETIA